MWIGTESLCRRQSSHGWTLKNVLLALLCRKYRAHEDIQAGRNRAWTRFVDRAERGPSWRQVLLKLNCSPWPDTETARLGGAMILYAELD